MGQPVTANIAHKLGTTEAKSRIGGGIQRIGEMIPGATLSDQRWEEDILHFTLDAMGQRIVSEMQVREEEVYVILDLPPLLAMFANKIKEKLQKEAPKMLE